MLKKLVVVGLGVAATLGWWTLRGSGASGSTSSSTLPSTVFGGGSPVELRVKLSHPGTVRAAFERGGLSDPDHQFLETWQEVPAGEHVFKIQVPRGISGSADVNIEAPPTGAEVKLTLHGANGKTLHHDNRLEEPLQPGYGFGAMVELEDWAEAQPSED